MYLHQTLTHTVKQEHGLLNTNLQLFPLLLLAHQSSPQGGTRPGTPPHRPDALHRRKGLQPDDLKHLAKRAADARRHHLHWETDDDETNKENQNPNEIPEERVENENDPYHWESLQKQWAVDIDRFQDKVLEDLSALRKRLGIRQ
ncbi:E4 protein [human papillomavirus 153]|uniref:E4 protein n=1 Tax=human papillomavirus 153 TaxID=1110710 RepID=G8GMM8_9PAPI|nr:E4 protein [human papillomavirus 153]